MGLGSNAVSRGGLFATAFVCLAITESYTSAISLQATALAVTVIAAGMGSAYSVGAGIYDTAVVAAVMLTVDSIVVAVNSYDPFTDNADRISEMAELVHEVRAITDALDAVIGQTDVGKQLPDSFVTMACATLVVIGLVYLLLVPLVIFFALVLAVFCAFVALELAGRPLDLSALIGLLKLRGIVVTNPIVLHGIEAGDDVRTDNFQSGVEVENLSDWYWYSHWTYTVRLLP